MATDKEKSDFDENDLAKQTARQRMHKKYMDMDIEDMSELVDLGKKIQETKSKILQDEKKYADFSKSLVETNKKYTEQTLIHNELFDQQMKLKRKMTGELTEQRKLSNMLRNPRLDEDELLAIQEKLDASRSNYEAYKALHELKGKEIEKSNNEIKQLYLKERLLNKHLPILKQNIDISKNELENSKETYRWMELKTEVQEKFKAVGDTLSSPYLVLTGLLSLAYKRFIELDGAAKAFRETTKFGKSQTAELDKEVERVSNRYAYMGIQAKDVYDAAAALSDEYGVMNEQVIKNSESISLMSKNLGVTNKNAAGFVAYMDRVGGMSSEQIQNMTGFAKQISKASKVPLDKLMDDVASASEYAKSMTGGQVINLIKASAQARMLGTNLNEVAKASRGLLDFNESINSELEASVLLGKNLSFMEARRKAFAGDLAGAQEETLKQVEKMGDLNEMNVLQQEALSKASGYSISDLQKMIKQKKDFNNLTAKEKADYEKLMKMKQTAAKDDNSARNALKEMEMQSTMDTLSAAFNQLKSLGAQILLPIVKILTPIAKLLSVVAGGVGYLTEKLTFSEDSIWGYVASIAAMGAAFYGLKKSIGLSFNILGKFTGMLKGGIFGKLSGGGSGGGIFSRIFGKKEDVEKSVQNTKSFSEKMKEFFENISSVAKSLGEIVKTAFKAIGDSIYALVNGISKGISKLGSSIGKAISDILKGISSGMKTIKYGDLAKMAIAFVVFSGGLFLLAKAIKEFGGVDFKSMAKAGIAMLGMVGIIKLMSNMLADAAKGSAVLLMMSAGFAAAAFGFSLFSKISWADLAKAGVAILGLTVAVIGLGAIMMSGYGAAAIVAGAAALAIMGAALIPFGVAALAAGAGMNLMGEGLSKIVPHLSELASISGGLMVAAAAITALGGAFAAFGVGQAAGGLASFVGNLFGGDQISKLKELAELGPKLQVTADAIKTINNPDASPVNTQQSSTGSTSNDAVVKKLDELISLMKSGGIAVNLDGKKVNQGLASAIS